MRLILLALLFFQHPDSTYEKADEFYYAQDYSSAIQLYKIAASEYLSIADSGRAATSLNDAGLCFHKLGKFDSAQWLYEEALKLDYLTNRGNVVLRLRNLAINYRAWGKFSKAISSLEEAKLLATESNSTMNLASINTSLGNLYLDQENYAKALAYFEEALTLHQSLKNEKGTAIAFTNLATTYYHMGKLDRSQEYYKISIPLKEELGDTSSLSYTYFGLGRVFLKELNYDSAELYLFRAYEIRKRLKEGLNLANTANELGTYFLAINHPEEAKIYLDDAYAYAMGQNNRSVLMESLRLLGSYHRATSDFELAYRYLERWSALRDSVFNEEKLKVLELQSQFDLDRSEVERLQAEEQANAANEKKQRAYLVTALIAVLLIGMIAFAVISIRQRKKLTALTHDLTQKNEQIATLNKQNFHFTKNSLAEIVSMLNVQIKSLEEGEVKETLTAEKLRMETTNLLYQQLFQSPETSQIALSSLLKSTVSNTMDAVLGFDRRAVSKFDLEEVFISSEKALTIAMITNEVCLNACKHAIREGGTFCVVLKKSEDEIQLSVHDNGHGYEHPVNENSFGLRLIEVLTSDLDADLSVDNDKTGLSYYFRIPTTKGK